ncbi:putative glutamine-serine-proline rich protein [Aspergillus saccharolyticus JOP 1030-1]|uniref:CNVH-domain-containing protein n=1 Tax=Aspergillus saccharolyticus JOP 1030-1 TaxID=1450539 RepID=A0A318ZGD1_9EURO|nr:CNVH-domain-containing protein [Aspergillus saccharolyticus JOP 1030-1]PYH46616.1 CNVH-domain-containing protein [Aspergillus saccharolyticus JOP 1030-1]
MSAQEYFGGSQNPRREETHTPGPWSSSTPGADTPRTGPYSPYPPSDPNQKPNYENYYPQTANPNQNYYATSPDPTRAHSPYQPMGQPSWSGPPGYPPYPPQEGGAPGNNPPYNDRPYSPYPQQPGHPQQPPPYTVTSEPNLPPSATDEQDRGFLGAVTGGAAGAFAGHKVNHGFLGAIGGALTGSVAEDAIKNHRKKKEEEEKEAQRRQKEALKEQKRREKEERKMQRRANRHNRHSSSSYRGNFSGSSREIRLEGYHELVAYCSDVNGHQHRSVLPLNDVLTNSWGELKWARHGNFAASASNVHLEDGGRVLVADLGNGNGGWKRSYIRLDERISNQNGRLVFLD